MTHATLPTWGKNLRGRLHANAPLAPYTTLKIGGPAEWFFEPADLADLATFMRQKPADMPVMVLGKGSNVLVSDHGIAGVVIHLEKGCDGVRVSGHTIYAEAGAASGKVARAARDAGLTGAEFLCGIPGSIGGALFMNAGAYGAETMPLVNWVDVLTNTGEVVRKTPDEIGYAYRRTNLPQGWLYLAAEFALKPGDKDAIRAQMRQINKNRSDSQPLDMPSSGSWFKNVEFPDGTRKNAWKMVDEAGCRGLKVGGAMVSVKHSNFFVNAGGATAADMLALSTQVEQKIKAGTGIEMHREVRFIGR